MAIFAGKVKPVFLIIAYRDSPGNCPEAWTNRPSKDREALL